MGRVKKRKSLDSLKKVRQSKRPSTVKSSKNLIAKKMLSQTPTMNINETKISTDEPVEVIEDDDNSLPTDVLESMKTVSFEVTEPNITSDEIIDITEDSTNITFENIKLENVQTKDHKKTAININNDDIIDITDITITNDKYENTPRRFPDDNLLFDDDDVQIIETTNNSIELIILDDSEEENTSNQNSIEKPISFKSVHERLGNSKKSSYNSPLRHRKRRWNEENITELDNNLGAFVIDKQKISNNNQNPPHNFIMLKQKAAKISKPHVSSTVTTSSATRKLRPIVIDGLNIGHA